MGLRYGLRERRWYGKVDRIQDREIRERVASQRRGAGIIIHLWGRARGGGVRAARARIYARPRAPRTSARVFFMP